MFNSNSNLVYLEKIQRVYIYIRTRIPALDMRADDVRYITPFGSYNCN